MFLSSSSIESSVFCVVAGGGAQVSLKKCAAGGDDEFNIDDEVSVKPERRENIPKNKAPVPLGN
jgi:hypothetical protein